MKSYVLSLFDVNLRTGQEDAVTKVDTNNGWPG